MVEALVLEGVLGTGRVAVAAAVIDRVLAADPAPQRRSVRPDLIAYAGLVVGLVGGQLAILDGAGDVLGLTLLGLSAAASFLLYVVMRPALPFLALGVLCTSLVLPQLVSQEWWLTGGLALLCSTLVAWRLHEERP